MQKKNLFLRAFQVWSILFLTSAISQIAVAGGLEVPDLGTVAIGRGTAFVARADDLTAFYYNPAGLSKSLGVNVLLNVNFVNLNVDYLRSGSQAAGADSSIIINGGRLSGCNPSTGAPCAGNPALDMSNGVLDPKDYESVSSSKKIGPAPVVVANWGDAFGVSGLALAIGLVPPSSFGTPAYPEKGAQRYIIREGNHLLAYPGLGVSYAFNRYFQIGGVFLSGMAILEQNQAIRPLPVTNDIDVNEDAGGDADLKIHVKDMFVPTGIFGVLSNPVDWLELGVAVKLPAKIKAKGNVAFTAPEAELQESKLLPGKDKVTLSQSFPLVVRGGLRYIHRLFDVEADFVWENWSALQNFDVDLDATLQTENGPESMPDSKIPKQFRDTWSVRLGGDVDVWPKHLTLRLGTYYQSSAYPKDNRTFAVDFPFAQQIGLGGGLTWIACKYLDVSAGFLHVFQPDVTVKKGIVQQQGLSVDVNEDGVVDNVGNTVNNGTYQVSMNLFGIALEGHF